MRYHGCDGIVKTGSAPDVVAELRGFTIEQATNALDATIIDGSKLRKTKQGQKSWNGTIEFLYDPADAGQLNIVNGQAIALEFYPIGEGNQKYSGNGLITGLSKPIEVDGMIIQSATFDGIGAITIDTGIPAGALLETTTGTPLTETTTSLILIES